MKSRSSMAGLAEENIMEMRKYTFGSLEFNVRNPRGVFVMSEQLKAKISQMTFEEAKAANSAAWKMKRECERGMARYSNVSKYPGLYDNFCGPYFVADEVRKETWRRMRSQ